MKNQLFDIVCKLDKETSRFFNKIKNKIKPLGEVKQTIPSKAEFYSYAGTDVKGYILDPEEDIDGKMPRPFPLLQGISFGRLQDKPVGTISCILFDSMRPFHRLLGQEKRIILRAADEYGKISTLYDGIVKFYDYLDWGMSVDDIVVEVSLNFTQLSQKLDLGKEVSNEVN